MTRARTGIPDEAWDRALAVLGSAPAVSLACHVDPDGDALGSMLALARFLESRGVAVTASFGTAGTAGTSGEASDGSQGSAPLVVPPQYSFLPGLDRLAHASEFPDAPDVLVVLDCGSPDRLGSLRGAAERAGTVVVIDHHASGTAFGDVRLLDGDAAATAVLVEELIHRAGGAVDRDAATCLYVGLVTDTGRFQHACTTPAVMELAARLLGAGIDHVGICRQVWDTHSLGYLKVLGRALDRAQFVPAAGLLWTAVRAADLAEHGIAPAETEGLIDVLRGLEAARCTMICKEQPDGSWKVSMRGRDGLDVGRLCAELGGGGHVFAAGFTSAAPLDDLVADVAALLGERRRGGLELAAAPR